MLQNEWQPNILDRLYQIMFKIIILSQIGTDRYQKHIFEILLLSPPWSVVHGWVHKIAILSDFQNYCIYADIVGGSKKV